MIVLTIIKDLNQPDWLESTWCDDENVVWCESYSGHREHIKMLEAKCVEYGTELTKEQSLIVKEVQEAFAYPSEEEIESEKETQRILSIKSKAKELIESKYPLYKQNNILMSGISVDIELMNEYISKIREISNEAEENKIPFENIDWTI